MDFFTNCVIERHRMKRDIIINIAVLDALQKKARSYADALTQLETASDSFLDVIKDQKGESYKKLSNLWDENISVGEGDLKQQLVVVADIVKQYIEDVEEYVQPVQEDVKMRVDIDDIWFNYQQIGSNVYDFNSILWDTGSSWRDYDKFNIMCIGGFFYCIYYIQVLGNHWR